MPVNIHPTINPAVLMPGDEATIAIDLENGAAAYGVGKDAGAGSTSQNALLSTPLNRTELTGTDQIQVAAADHRDLGMIGPNDKVTVYYKIKALKNASSGTYLLDFGVWGGYDIVNINREIAIKVDSATPSLAQADVPTKPSISLNVANPRDNTLNAVTVVPSAPGISFAPDEYYIGTMDPDEVFTISFGITSSNRAKQLNEPVNLSFVSRFKNGDTWHESEPYTTIYIPPQDGSKPNYYLPIGAAAVVLLAAGVYAYRRKKNSKEQAKNVPLKN
jgi:hypothetical protein